MFKEQIFVKTENPEQLARIFYPEETSLNSQRFTYSLKIQKGKLCFNLEAQDKTAFKTVRTTIKKLLSVYDKMSKISKTNKRKRD
jgi:tRNA threonylcarbamoyladenosine modification (KEOPS) complex  Pcc1 subunit